MSIQLNCFSCGKENVIVDRVGRRDECSQCHADLHVCKNCRFYDRSAYNECKETAADVVRAKEESNFCDFFEIGTGAFKKSEKEDMLAKAEALFKKN